MPPALLYLAIIVVLGAVVVLTVRKWKREDPIVAQREKLQNAMALKDSFKDMARDLQEALETNPTMTPAQVGEFIEQWSSVSAAESITSPPTQGAPMK